MRKLTLVLFAASMFFACGQQEQAPPPPPPVEEPAGPVTVNADEKYVAICKDGLAAMSSGDMERFVSDFTDNVVYQFAYGDSLVGKTAVLEYWKDRRENAIEDINFSNSVWLSVTVDASNNYNVAPGDWVMGWFLTTASYKATGKSMTQNIHTLYHFNGSGKVDRVIQYLDRAAIMQASSQ
ncbi:nuclear transport factor 2 family protein [Fulvivirga sedimenti]|uniref:Ester cyclase n=1 Tax=Fulvivirga sedimenti TaxID=2879465 RepID=A0A9X1HM92_9BACT|nr:nuclear transport factor 2 family protein [Fulvivirga sedimenti]MCA6074743.1 ester cyclase [Fulvivirga sedimenti]MCA6075920.1 ester cyclase [Fulvivirga sedimenti]MCA6077048.1 ester cyclase [Fulvivirga sedimenti]